VTAVVYRLRCVLRAEWRATLWLGLLVATASGAVLAIASGAQRTSSAPDRYTAASGGNFDAVVTQQGGAPRTGEVTGLTGAASVRSMTFVFGGFLGDGGEPLDALTFAGSPVASGSRLVDGREADAGRDTEFVATRSFVDAHDVDIGSTFRLVTFTQQQADEAGFDAPDPAGPTLEATLVGIIDGPGEIDFPTPLAIFSPALLDADPGVSATIMAVELHDDVDLGAFRTQLDALAGGDELSVERGVLVNDSVRRAITAQGTGLWLLAAAAAAAVVVVIGQIISRHVRVSADERSRLAALGFADRQMVAEAAARQAVPVLVGLFVGAGVAVLASGVFPTGFIRRLEPDPGLRIEPVVLAAGFLILLLALMAWTLAAVMMKPRRAAPAPSSIVDAIASGGSSAPAVVGIRFALTRRRDERGSVAANLAGVALTVAGGIAAITFATSLDRLVAEPERWGNDYDLAFGSGVQEISDEIRRALDADPDVDALTVYSAGQARAGGTTLGVVGMEQVSGDSAPPVTAGRLPASEDEIGLGRLTAEELSVGVGDELVLDGVSGARGFVVTGLVVLPNVAGVDGVGKGGLVSMGALRTLDDSIGGGTAVVGLRPGAAPGAAERLSSLTGMMTGPPSLPPPIITVARVRSVPFVLAALLGGLGALSLAHVMLTSVHGRRRDVAVLRAIGADRPWISRAIHWQATVFLAVAVAIALPSGLVVGRRVFIAFADRLGARNEPAVPVFTVAALVVAALVLANAAAALSARRARHLTAAELLHRE